MRLTVEKTPYNKAYLDVPFTVSIGLCSGMMGRNQTTQIAKEDKNLYVAKESGRNRVVG